MIVKADQHDIQKKENDMTAAIHAMDQLRKGCLYGEEARSWSAMPQIEELRKQVTPADFQMLVDFAKGSDKELSALSFSLLRYIETDPRVQEFFGDIWERTTDYRSRHTLMWRLLDNPNLSPAMHEQIYMFVQADWTRWLEETARWYNADNVLTAVEKKLADPSFPPSKAWAYLCSAMMATDKPALRQLLGKYSTSRDPFVAKVARDLICKM